MNFRKINIRNSNDYYYSKQSYENKEFGLLYIYLLHLFTFKN